MKNLALSLFILTTTACTGCMGDDPASAPTSSPSTPEYVLKIREARSDIEPLDDSITVKVIEEHNDYLAAGQDAWARNCLTYADTFVEVERLTLYDAALVAGMAAHESAGCNMGASDRAGGRGLMQITSKPSKAWIRDVARLLSIETSEVDYRNNPLHNVTLGVVFLDDYERQLGSRSHGLLAYNMGPGCKRITAANKKGCGYKGVRGVARKMGYDPSSELPTIVEMYPHLRFDSSAKPRVYVARVLALAVMMDKVMAGEEIVPLESLDVEQIPGWDPELDGDDWHDQFIASE